MTIIMPPGVHVTGLAGIGKCELGIVVQGGDVFRLREGDSANWVGSLPGGRRIALEANDSGNLLAWSDAPEFLATVRFDPFTVDSVEIPKHGWGGKWMGPLTKSGGDLFFAALSNPNQPRRAPTGAHAARMLTRIGRSASDTGSIGPLLRPSTAYIPWLESQAALGTTRGNIVIVLLEPGIVLRYRASDGDSLAAFGLPRYFRTETRPPAILRLPWIQFGEFPYFFDTPQVLSAAVDRVGNVYALRPLQFHWEARANPYVADVGVWRIDRQMLEIYDGTGASIGRFEAPVTWHTIVLDDNQRIFVILGEEIAVFQNPLSGPTSCRSHDLSVHAKRR